MFRVIDCSKPVGNVVEINQLGEGDFLNNIIVAEKGEIQDILVYVKDVKKWEGGFYTWTSVYCREVGRSKYPTIKEAVKSRFDKGMAVYVFKNRGEFRSFIKYNGCRE